MTETVLFRSESEQTRASIAAYLRTVADSLDSGREVTLKAGNQSVTMDPPARPTFEVKAGREDTEGPGERNILFELGWDNSEDDGIDEPADSGWTSSR